MDNTFQRDVEAAIAPHRPGTLSCGWGSEAPGSRKCKEPGCNSGGQFHFAGYCSGCAVKHNIPLLTVTSAAAEPDDDCSSEGR
jgi:hypothetical protein